MKTPIQEVIDLINEINDNDLSEFNYYYQFIMDKLNQLLEKEKEQIIKSWNNGYSIGCVVGSNDYTNEDEEKDNGNYYYNQTYNQNK